MQTIQLISLRHSAFYTPYLITFIAGFLEEQGLLANYRCVSNVDELESALLTGQADVAQSAVAVSMRKTAGTKKNENRVDRKIYHFAQINQKDGFFIARALGNEESTRRFNWGDLENKSIIADHLFQPMATLKFVLEQAGVNLSKITFIDAGNAEQSQAAFLAGEAEFIHLQGPYPQQLAEQGKVNIVASVGEALGPIAYSSLCATNDWLAKPMAIKFISAYKKALAYVQDTDAKRLAEKLHHQFESVSLDTLTQTIEAYKALGTWSSTTDISRDTFQRANQVFLHSGDIDSPVNYEDVVKSIMC